MTKNLQNDAESNSQNRLEELKNKITPKNDIVFKRIFGMKGNEAILKDFLEAILNLKIDALTLDLNTELLPEFYNGKSSMVDVRARLSDGTEVNVEIQVDVTKYSERRCMYYWSKLYANNSKKGNDYEKLNKVICIWILEDKVYDEFEDFISKWKMFNEEHGVGGHFGDIEFRIIELKKYRESATIKKNVRDFWLAFIDHKNEEMVKMACVTNEQIKKAREELDKIRANKALMNEILAKELAENDYASAMARAERKGKLENKKEIAKNLLKINMSIEQIAEVTGLSRDEILKLKEEE